MLPLRYTESELHGTSRLLSFHSKIDPFESFACKVWSISVVIFERRFLRVTQLKVDAFWQEVYKRVWRVGYRCRPHYAKCTGSHPNSEVKRHKARWVLRWGTARETRVLPAFFAFFTITSRLRFSSFVYIISVESQAINLALKIKDIIVSNPYFPPICRLFAIETRIVPCFIASCRLQNLIYFQW